MEGNVWRPTHLTSEQMEERRLAVATLLRQGQFSQADIVVLLQFLTQADRGPDEVSS
jgi:hypothetical protein